jgi:hypothetical protein
MLRTLARIFQPFRQWPEPEPAQSSLAMDKTWSELRDRYRKDRAAHAKSEPSWKALNRRTHDMLAGRG